MAKASIKSEKITPFGGIFHVREHFSRFVGPVIDKVLGLRCTSYGYQYSEIAGSLASVYFCGGNCVEDVTSSNDDDVHRIVLIRPPWAECSALCPQLALCSLMHAQKKQRFCQDGVPSSRVLRVLLRRLPLQYVGSRPSTAD